MKFGQNNIYGWHTVVMIMCICINRCADGPVCLTQEDDTPIRV